MLKEKLDSYLYEEVETATKGRVRRVATRVFHHIAVMSVFLFVGGCTATINHLWSGGMQFGAVLMSTVVPFCLLYPLVRSILFAEKDSALGALVTLIIQEWAKSSIGRLLSNSQFDIKK
jgi:hypothetical protein